MSNQNEMFEAMVDGEIEEMILQEICQQTNN